MTEWFSTRSKGSRRCRWTSGMKRGMGVRCCATCATLKNVSAAARGRLSTKSPRESHCHRVACWDSLRTGLPARVRRGELARKEEVTRFMSQLSSTLLECRQGIFPEEETYHVQPSITSRSITPGRWFCRRCRAAHVRRPAHPEIQQPGRVRPARRQQANGPRFALPASTGSPMCLASSGLNTTRTRHSPLL